MTGGGKTALVDQENNKNKEKEGCQRAVLRIIVVLIFVIERGAKKSSQSKKWKLRKEEVQVHPDDDEAALVLFNEYSN